MRLLVKDALIDIPPAMTTAKNMLSGRQKFIRPKLPRKNTSGGGVRIICIVRSARALW